MRSRLLAGAVIGGAFVTGGWLLQRGTVVETVNGAQLFDQVRRQVATNYVDSLPESRLYRRAIDGMLRELGDPHTRFLSGRRLDQLQENTTGRYEGIGVRIDLRDGWITVVAPLPGTPAERAGILTGDRIVEIDGKNTHGWSSDEAAQAIRGTPGSAVNLLVERPGSSAMLPFKVQRREVRVRSVQRVTMLRDGAGYVDIDIFSETTGDELERAVASLRSRGMKTLIVDLRGNPGGLLDQGVQVSELFLDDGQAIVRMRGRTRDANRDFAARTEQRWPELPLIVLVDSGSASASEIVAGAWQDHDRALVLGTVTFGKGSAQSLYALSDSSALKLTTARWFTPLGRSIDRPVIETSEDEESDAPADSEPPRPTYRTPTGRTVQGGGGIVPDLVVPEVALTTDDRRLQDALGDKIPQFRDALTSAALAMRASGGVRPDFTVTSAMREDLWRRVEARRIVVPREIFDASPLVTRLLTAEIARYVFGDVQAFVRTSADDPTVQTAIGLAAGAADQRALFERAARQRSRGSTGAVGMRERSGSRG